MFAYGVLPDFQLQTGPGEFNETIFQAFDYVISEASKRNLKLLIGLSSNWIYSPNQSDTKCAPLLTSYFTCRSAIWREQQTHISTVVSWAALFVWSRSASFAGHIMSVLQYLLFLSPK